MASAHHHLLLLLFLSISFTAAASSSSSAAAAMELSLPPHSSSPPSPAAWPPQFHAVLYSNNSGALRLTDLWYDWPRGRNFNIIQKQLGELLYDLEWDNGTSFYYTLPPAADLHCRTLTFPVGVLRPNWLDGATYLGRETLDGFTCDVWEKVDFIRYYEDVATRRPVYWVFYTGMAFHVMTFEVGAVLEDDKWQAPAYCFQTKDEEQETVKPKSIISDDFQRNLWQEKSLTRASSEFSM